MSQNDLTFDNENLVVDYITFKFQNLQSQQTEIANYLFNLGFNVYQESGKFSKPMREEILMDSKNKYETCFVQDSFYWQGTLLRFSGINAARFYFLAKQNNIDWNIFDNGILSRFDLYLQRELKETDQISTKAFLANCQQELKQKNKNINLEKNQKGWILKIGNRKTNNYSRIYEGKNFLKFEHEMKGKFLQTYHLLLVKNDFQKLEHKLSSHFFVYFGKLLPLQHSYLDWLVIKLRPIQKKLTSKGSFNSDYIQSEIICDPRKFIMFLQFLNYAQSLDYEMKELENIPYRVVTFRLRDFLVLQNEGHQDNQYQLKKLKYFFEELQKGFLITSFSDNYFQSLAAVPSVRFEKVQKFWVGKVCLVNELFYYSYPFCLSNFFNTKLTKNEFEVRFKFTQVFSSTNIEKIFCIQEFFDSYPSVISNQRKTNIKKYFIQLVQELKNNDFIEPDHKIISDGSWISVDELTSSNISEGFILYEKLSL
jgi:hypothetical protein